MAELDNSTCIYFARLHWIIFFLPGLFLIGSVGFGIYGGFFKEFAYLLSAFSLIWLAVTWVTYYFSSLTIQKKRVILRTGVLVRQTIDMPLNKIETIDIRQTLVGSLFHYGTLIITGTGGTRHFVNFLQKPLTCRRYIEQLMNEQ